MLVLQFMLDDEEVLIAFIRALKAARTKQSAPAMPSRSPPHPISYHPMGVGRQ